MENEKIKQLEDKIKQLEDKNKLLTQSLKKKIRKGIKRDMKYNARYFMTANAIYEYEQGIITDKNKELNVSKLIKIIPLVRFKQHFEIVPNKISRQKIKKYLDALVENGDIIRNFNSLKLTEQGKENVECTRNKLSSDYKLVDISKKRSFCNLKT